MDLFLTMYELRKRDPRNASALCRSKLATENAGMGKSAFGAVKNAEMGNARVKISTRSAGHGPNGSTLRDRSHKYQISHIYFNYV